MLVTEAIFSIWYAACHLLVTFEGQKNLKIIFYKKCRIFAKRSFGKLGVTKVYNMFLDFMAEVHHLVVTVMLSRGWLYHVMADTHKLSKYTSQAYANERIMSTLNATNIPLSTIKRWWSKVFQPVTWVHLWATSVI